MIEEKFNPQVENALKILLQALQPQQPIKSAKDIEAEVQDRLVSEAAIKAYKRFDDYPDTLRAKHVGAILDISIVKAYEVLNSKKCPGFTVGRSKRVLKKEFIDYLIVNQGNDLID